MYYSPHHLVTTDEKKQKASTTIPCGNNKNNYHHTMDNLMPEKKTLQCTDKIIILWCLPIKKTPKSSKVAKQESISFYPHLLFAYNIDIEQKSLLASVKIPNE